MCLWWDEGILASIQGYPSIALNQPVQKESLTITSKYQDCQVKNRQMTAGYTFKSIQGLSIQNAAIGEKVRNGAKSGSSWGVIHSYRVFWGRHTSLDYPIWVKFPLKYKIVAAKQIKNYSIIFNCQANSEKGVGRSVLFCLCSNILCYYSRQCLSSLFGYTLKYKIYG